MPTGTVKFYDADRGFGYLAPDDGSPDVAVDETALNVIEILIKDQHVSYELTKGTGGELRALNVVPL
ncbi:cold shock domain-containing protein [Streptomyces sp. NPDC051776]|uniref:cold-shock protein n=1 Tax=Streptomyces sp. NPDC051776 TaxID=3155414 RepID=UPI00343001BA